VPGFSPVPDDRLRLLGARDLDAAEVEALDRSGIRRTPAESIDADSAADIAREVSADAPLYLHLDLDVLDPRDGRANHFATSAGVRASALLAFCSALAAHTPIGAVTLSAYDPAVDDDGLVRAVAFDILDAILRD
jgi:arginase